MNMERNRRRQFWMVDRTNRPAELLEWRMSAEQDGFNSVAAWLRWLGTNRAKVNARERGRYERG